LRFRAIDNHGKALMCSVFPGSLRRCCSFRLSTYTWRKRA